jgi:hypothetical protein
VSRPLLSRNGQRLEEEEPEQEAAAQAAQVAQVGTPADNAYLMHESRGPARLRAGSAQERAMNIIIIVAVILVLALGVVALIAAHLRFPATRRLLGASLVV